MTYRYDRHESAAAQKSFDELIDARRLCVHMFNVWTQYMIIANTDRTRQMCRIERRWWMLHHRALTAELNKR